MLPTLPDDGLFLEAIAESLYRQALVAKLAVEAFRTSRTAKRLAGGAMAPCRMLAARPLEQRTGDELGAVVGRQHLRCAMHTDQLRKDFDDPARTDRANTVDGKALAGVFVDNRQAFQLLTLRRRRPPVSVALGL